MAKDKYYGKTLRKNFARHEEVMAMPNLLEIQKKSYQWFLDTGLREVFKDVGAITDYAASGLVQDNDKPGTNVTGASDLTPVAEQLEMMQKVLPDVKKVGLLYCTAESNSDVQIKAAKKELDKLGLEYTDFTVSSSNEIQSVVESAVGKVDALYSPTDNTIAAGASQVGQICKENKLPFVTGEEGMCMAGGLFTLSINYEDLGYAAGEMAVKILKGEAKPEDMPIKHLSSKDLVVVKNDEMAEALGIDLSALDA